MIVAICDGNTTNNSNTFVIHSFSIQKIVSISPLLEIRFQWNAKNAVCSVFVLMMLLAGRLMLWCWYYIESIRTSRFVATIYFSFLLSLLLVLPSLPPPHTIHCILRAFMCYLFIFDFLLIVSKQQPNTIFVHINIQRHLTWSTQFNQVICREERARINIKKKTAYSTQHTSDIKHSECGRQPPKTKHKLAICLRHFFFS